MVSSIYYRITIDFAIGFALRSKMIVRNLSICFSISISSVLFIFKYLEGNSFFRLQLDWFGWLES